MLYLLPHPLVDKNMNLEILIYILGLSIPDCSWWLSFIDSTCLPFCCSVAKLCPILCDPMDCSIPGSSVFMPSWSLFKFMSIGAWCYLYFLNYPGPCFTLCLQSSLRLLPSTSASSFDHLGLFGSVYLVSWVLRLSSFVIDSFKGWEIINSFLLRQSQSNWSLKQSHFLKGNLKNNEDTKVWLD